MDACSWENNGAAFAAANKIAALARNLTDERVLSFGGDTPLAGSTFGAQSNYSFWGRGQTLSLQGTLRF